MTPDDVVKRARAWIGQDFAPGQSAQCANFVRSVFRDVGYELPQAAHPDDLVVNPGEDLAPSYADSLAGDEIGPKIPRDQVQGGDLVLFANTYGGYPEGTITHVGIATDHDYMVDRSTSAHPVLERPIGTFWGEAGSFAEARRPRQFLSAPAPMPVLPGPVAVDMGVGHWAEKQVQICLQNGLMSLTDNKFYGGKYATRYELAIVAARLLEKLTPAQPASVVPKALVGGGRSLPTPTKEVAP